MRRTVRVLATTGVVFGVSLAVVPATATVLAGSGAAGHSRQAVTGVRQSPLGPLVTARARALARAGAHPPPVQPVPFTLGGASPRFAARNHPAARAAASPARRILSELRSAATSHAAATSRAAAAPRFATISGTVTSRRSGHPIAGVCVFATQSKQGLFDKATFQGRTTRS